MKDVVFVIYVKDMKSILIQIKLQKIIMMKKMRKRHLLKIILEIMKIN